MSYVIKFDGPEGPESHEFAGKITNQEAIQVQTVTGMLPPEWLESLDKLDPTSWTALVQMLWRRQGKPAKFDTIEFDLMSCDLEPVGEGSPGEAKAAEDDAEAAGDADPN